MTNADKYLKDGVDVEELINDLYKYNDNRKYVTNEYAKIQSANFFRDFLQQPIKPTLTESEKNILEHIRLGEYNKIGRKLGGALYLEKSNGNGIDSGFDDFFEGIFEWIHEGEKYDIKELIESDT